MKREKIYDSIRVFCALSVVMGHVISRFTHETSITVNFVASNLIDSASRVSVPVFLMLAGFYAIAKYKDFEKSANKAAFIGSYYWGRLVKIIFPAMAAAVFYHVVLDGKGDILGKPFSEYTEIFSGLFSFNAIFASSGYMLYFVYLIAFYYAWTPLIWMIRRLSYGKMILGAALALWLIGPVMSASAYYYLGIDSVKALLDFFNANHPVIKYCGYFLWGGVYLPGAIQRFKDDDHFAKIIMRVFKTAAAFTIAVPYMLLVAGITNDPFHSYRDTVHIHIIALSVSFLIIFSQDKNEFFNPDLVWIAWPMYLSHGVWIWMLHPGIEKLDKIPLLPIVVESALVITASICFSWLFFRPAKDDTCDGTNTHPYYPYYPYSSPRIYGSGLSEKNPPSSPANNNNNELERQRQSEKNDSDRVIKCGLRNEYPAPSKLTISLTNECQHHCDMCLKQDEQLPNMERDIDFWEDVIKATRFGGMRYVFSGGGDPLLYPSFGYLWDFMTGLNLDFEIHTNGEKMEEFAERFVSSPRCKVVLSVNGLCEVHNAIRDCTTAFQSIERFIEIVKKNAPLSLDRLAINTTILPYNLSSHDYMSNMLSFFRDKWGIKDVRLEHLQLCSMRRQKETWQLWKQIFPDYKSEIQVIEEDTPSYLRLNYNQMSLLHGGLLKLQRDGKMPSSMLPALTLRDMRRYYSTNDDTEMETRGLCRAAWNTPHLTPAGRLLLCSSPMGGFTSGRIENGWEFWELWGNENSRKFRNELLERGGYPICRHCHSFYSN